MSSRLVRTSPYLSDVSENVAVPAHHLLFLAMILPADRLSSDTRPCPLPIKQRFLLSIFLILPPCHYQMGEQRLRQGRYIQVHDAARAGFEKTANQQP